MSEQKPSRSQSRRIAIQKGKPIPAFVTLEKELLDDVLECLNTLIERATIKNSPYVQQFCIPVYERLRLKVKGE